MILFKGTRDPRLLLLSQPLDVVHQVVAVNFHPGLLVGQLIYLTPQVTHLVLVQISDSGGAFAPQLLQLRQQDLVLLLQEAHLLDVTGEPVVERLHLRLLVGAVGDELGVYGVGQGEVQVLGRQTGHGRAAPEPLGLQRVDGRSGGEAVRHPGGAQRAGELTAGVARPGDDSVSSEHPLVRRMRSWSLRHLFFFFFFCLKRGGADGYGARACAFGGVFQSVLVFIGSPLCKCIHPDWSDASSANHRAEEEKTVFAGYKQEFFLKKCLSVYISKVVSHPRTGSTIHVHKGKL